MEVLARYCSIPGYNKLCCESCSKKVSITSQPPSINQGAPGTGKPGDAILPSPLSQLPVHPTVTSHLQRIKGTVPKETEPADGPLAASAALGTFQTKIASQSRGSSSNSSSKVGMPRLVPPTRQMTVGWGPRDLRNSLASQLLPAVMDDPLTMPRRESKLLLPQDSTRRRKDSREPKQSASSPRTSSPVGT